MSKADEAYKAAAREIARVRKAGGTSLSLFGDRFRALERLPDEIANWTGLQRLDLRNTQITDAGLAHVAGLTGLQSLYLWDTQITDAGLVHVAGLTGLQSLDLMNTPISDAGLAHVGGLTGLQFLDLMNTQITDAGLAQVAGLTGLQSLALTGTQITDAGLVHVAGLTGLQFLFLSRTPITDAGLAQVAGLTALQSLNLWNTQITDAGLAQVAGLVGLQRLDLMGTQITDAGLAHVVGLTALLFLDLSSTKITDAGLVHVAGLTRLQSLDLRLTQVRDLRPICDLPFDKLGNALSGAFGLQFTNTPAAKLDQTLGELAEVADHKDRTEKTQAYLRGLPRYPQEYLFADTITLDAILTAQTPLGWKFSPAHGALVVYIEETPLSQFQTQMAQQTALRAEDLKRKIGGANFGVRGDVAVEVQRLTDILADSSRSLYERSFDLWASLIALGGHLDSHDRGRIDGRDPLDLLSPEQRTALMTLLTIAGNLVRSFPQIKDMDEGAGNFLRREVTLDMVAQMIEQALRAAFVAQQSAALMQHVAGVAKGTGGQSDKATSVTVRGLGNLITSASLIIGKRVLQVAGAAAIGAATGAGAHVGEAVADAYELEKPAIAFIERISGIAPEFIDAMPADEAAQVRAALREAQDKIEALRAAGDVTRR